MTLKKKKKKKKKNFFGREAFYGRSDVDNQTIYFFWPYSDGILQYSLGLEDYQDNFNFIPVSYMFLSLTSRKQCCLLSC